MKYDSRPIHHLTWQINQGAGPKVVLFVAGGGTEVFPWLLNRGGGSATLLSGRIPYDRADFVAILGSDPGKLVDPRAARGLAMAAFRHGVRLRPDLAPDDLVGIGATSKLTSGPTERPGRTHEIHLAAQTASRTLVRSMTLPPGDQGPTLDRVQQEHINALAILYLLAETQGLIPPVLDIAGITDTVADAASCGQPEIPRLLGGQVRWLSYRLGGSKPLGMPHLTQAPTRLILPGSFRPLHPGHLRMAEIASDLIGAPCGFEMSLFHPEKPPLDYLSIADRVARFAGVPGYLLLTDAPTYLDKARLFPGSTFVVGYDTAVRIVEPKWYGGSGARDAMLDELEALGTRFLVFGRVDEAEQFRDLSREAFADSRVARFVATSTQVVAETHFRLDVSSTTLRVGVELP